MENQDFVMHYVSTLNEARELIDRQSSYWISNCGCREGKGHCGRSRMDVCLYFNDEFAPTGTEWKEVTRDDVYAVMSEAKTAPLVARPFRNEQDTSKADGICFCCDDCCAYFLDPSEKCDRGRLIEKTDLDACTQCGLCPDVCYFRARQVVDGTLAVDRDKCYGCGLCVDACPENCVSMIQRG